MNNNTTGKLNCEIFPAPCRHPDCSCGEQTFATTNTIQQPVTSESVPVDVEEIARQFVKRMYPNYGAPMLLEELYIAGYLERHTANTDLDKVRELLEKEIEETKSLRQDDRLYMQFPLYDHLIWKLSDLITQIDNIKK